MKMQNFTPKDAKGWLILAAIAVAVIFLFSWIKKKIFGITPITGAVDGMVEKDAATMSVYMSNGMTYGECAEWLYRSMYRSGFLSWAKNTDEKEIGALLLKVTPGEYAILSRIYMRVKGELWTEGTSIFGLINLRFSSAMSDTLTEDLKSLFSKSEQKQYLSHLNVE